MLMVAVVAALLHRYVNGDVPPVTVVVAEPFALPHVEDVGAAESVGPGVFTTVALDITVQPFASVTVIE
jgi:hypothetical protein